MNDHTLAVPARGPAPGKPRRRLLRYLLVGGGLLVLVAILVGIKGAQIGSLISMGKKMQAAGPPPETVASAVAHGQPWENTLEAVGSVSGLKSVTISAEAPGVVTRIAFESGQLAQQGQILAELDNSVERAQLAAAKARLDLAEVTANRSRKLAAGNAISKAQLDDTEAQLRTATTDVAAQQALLEHKVIRAPFKGRLGIRAINLGQFLSAGTPITTLDSIGASFVDFSLPQEELPYLKDGLPVRITLGLQERGGQSSGRTGRGDGAAAAPAANAAPENRRGEQVIEGTIAAIDPTVDPATRNVKVRAAIPDGVNKPRPGMFVNVAVVLPGRPTIVTIPATAVVHATYGDSVFVIEPKKPGSPGADKSPAGKPISTARQQFVRLGPTRGDFVAVTKGLTDGQQIVSEGAFKLRNGAPIVVDNSVKPTPELDPHPPNR
ncbi:MAG TPA: efflux RND transporter periplasmic adaptor subunit [Polyangia bacterium]